MCGFVGEITIQGVDHERLRSAIETIRHRGPDDSGIQVLDDGKVGLGFRRLAILDLSPAGNQPMPNEDQNIWIVFNGEIYNFLEIRAQLVERGHRFISHSDTEVLLHGYEEWGEAILERVQGMFAFALWDAKHHLCFLARDRVGIKPLYYSLSKGSLYFASELKGLLKLINEPRKIDPLGFFDFLTYRYVPSPRTIYSNIFKLEAGHSLIFCDGRLEKKRYWDIEFREINHAIGMADAAEAVREQVKDAVRSHLLSDVPVGIFLSGGLDSSTIAFWMKQFQQTPVHAFSIGFKDARRDDLPFASQMADVLGMNHHVRLLDFPSVLDQLRIMVDVFDEPFADPSSIPTLAVSQLAKESVKVILSGEGGDEVFAGYDWYRQVAQVDRFRPWGAFVGRPPVVSFFDRLGSGVPKIKKAAYIMRLLGCSSLENYITLTSWLGAKEIQMLVGSAYQAELRDHDTSWAFKRYWNMDLPLVKRMQYLDMKTYLPDQLLVKADRASMAASIEARVPFLDPRLIDLVFNFPERIVSGQGDQKYLQKQAVARDLPPEIVHRKKMGFVPPIDRWLNLHNEAWIKEYISHGVAVENGLFSIDPLTQLDPFQYEAKIWQLLVFECWARKEFNAT